MVSEALKVRCVYALTILGRERPAWAIVGIVLVCLSGHPGFWEFAGRLESLSFEGAFVSFRRWRRGFRFRRPRR